MICHKNKIIFIHITKCAGSSIESMFGYKPFPVLISDREHLLGWDDEFGVYLQHISTKEIFKHKLISDDIWEEYNKFTIVRNPWDRAVSAYYSNMKDTGISDTFENFLFRRGKYTKVLNDRSDTKYRGQYADTQMSFINHRMDDINIIRYENIKGVNSYLQSIGINKKLPHINKTSKIKSKPTFYRDNNEFADMVSDVYSEDIKKFNYSFK